MVDAVTHEWGTSQADRYPAAEIETDPPPPPEMTTQQINILRVDRNAPEFHFETSLPWDEVNNRQTTLGRALSESRPGHRVVAAINGDFWRYDHGQPHRSLRLGTASSRPLRRVPAGPSAFSAMAHRSSAVRRSPCPRRCPAPRRFHSTVSTRSSIPMR